MARKEDPAFEIAFYESVLKRDSSYEAVIGLLGGLYTKVGRINDGLKMDRRLVKLRPDDAVARYNLACSLALLKRRKDALRTLREAIDMGYDDHNWMQGDADLESLRGDPEFEELMSRLQNGS